MANPQTTSPSADPDLPPPHARTSARATRPSSASERFAQVRGFSEALCAPLDAEDCVAQSMPEASPTKWHLAHTTWFFETFVLAEYIRGYSAYDPKFGFLFNSYYNGVGERHARPERGALTRPTLAEVFDYRRHVDEEMAALLERRSGEPSAAMLQVVEIGLHHEQQHQELILTDIKHLFAQNALLPAYRSPLEITRGSAETLGWTAVPEGVHRIGHAGQSFSYDNERPAHRVFVPPCQIADRLVSNGEYRDFIADGAYRRPDLWLDVGWSVVQAEAWQEPLYWRGGPDGYTEMTLAGERELCDAEPVSHVSFVEADAFARWANARLPTEAEWEVTCASQPIDGNFIESGRLHPAAAAKPNGSGGSGQFFGDLWEWTSSSYSAYPGYRPDPGILGEYNGKFMCDQHVLRGGSCGSAQSHLRASYRNFFHAPDRWQFSGIRLAKEFP